MQLGVGQAVGAAEQVAELVVDADPGGGQGGAGQPGPEQGVGPGGQVGRVGRPPPGSPRVSALAPSSARAEVTGLAPGAYRASTQWARAFMPLGPVTSAGRPVVSAGS